MPRPTINKIAAYIKRSGRNYEDTIRLTFIVVHTYNGEFGPSFMFLADRLGDSMNTQFMSYSKWCQLSTTACIRGPRGAFIDSILNAHKSFSTLELDRMVRTMDPQWKQVSTMHYACQIQCMLFLLNAQILSLNLYFHFIKAYNQINNPSSVLLHVGFQKAGKQCALEIVERF